MYVTVERTSGSTVNYNNVRLDFDFKEIYDISYVDMNNTGYPSTILNGDNMSITFSDNSTYNGTATYSYNTNTLTVNSYTSTIPFGFTVTGTNTSNSYTNNVLTITNVTSDITITKQAPSAQTLVQTILSMASGYSDASTNAIDLGQGTGGCNIKLAYDGTTNKNLRYIGLNPCNYVSFQGITWRIIGVFNNVEVDGKTEKETLVKLISAENYNSTQMAWNSSSVNNWVGSTLYNTLNTTFYTADLNSSSYVEKVKWPVGGTTSNNNSPSAYYTAERNTGSDSSSNTDHNPAGYVGLFYPSDYGLATDGGSDSGRTTCLSTSYNQTAWRTGSNRVCSPNTWLYTETGSNYFWTITPISSAKNSVYRVGNAAIVATNIYSNQQLSYVRPVIFLKGDVKVESGDGSSGTGAYTLTQ